MTDDVITMRSGALVELCNSPAASPDKLLPGRQDPADAPSAAVPCRFDTVAQVSIDDLPDGWTRLQLKSYESIRDDQGRCMMEVYESGRVLVHPEAVQLLGIVPDTWGADSARSTWGTVYA